MKTWRLLSYLVVATVGYAQSFYSFQYPLRLSPQRVPNTSPYCVQNPQSFGQQAGTTWYLFCRGGSTGLIKMGTVPISGSGSGACPTETNGTLAPCTDPTGGYAPTFSPQSYLSGGVWTIFEQVGNASINFISAIPPFYACAAPSSSQSPIPPATFNDVVCPPPNPSPIIIDLTGEGFRLTSKANGVKFREEAGGPIEQMSWTDPAHHNAWLVKPNSDGTVTSLAANMFGNLSPQPESATPNGYSALAYLAEQEGCGKLSKLDSSCAVWGQLRLWHDANQDGVAQPDELQTLDAAGVTAISLKYHESDWTDQYGNQFRYEGGIDDAAGPHDKRTYDVFLVF